MNRGPSTPRRTARWARWVATTGGLGDRLPAPGTLAGSLPAAAAWALVAVFVDSPLSLAAITGIMTATAIAAGLWATRWEIRRRGAEDPGAVVVDEVAGMWTTYLITCLALDSQSSVRLSLILVGGFFLFRFFDIMKPWPIGALERLEGSVGVMADDLAAGVLAGLGVVVVAWIS